MLATETKRIFFNSVFDSSDYDSVNTIDKADIKSDEGNEDDDTNIWSLPNTAYQHMKIKIDDTNNEVKHKLRVVIEHKLGVTVGHMKEELEVKKASVYVDSDISKESINVATFSDESYFNILLMMIN